ncbi:MAG: hypothetical protein GWO11_00580 [Desulfuromonadales bacterium]|nr:hypothetical protein [Desulfuromonadales bacterium]
MRGALIVLLGICLGGCLGSEPPRPDMPAATSIAGKVTRADGDPPGDAFVYAYRDERNSTRGPADFGIRTESDGSYLLELPPGSYLLIARQGRSSRASGPPRPGESWDLYSGNPVTVDAGETVTADFTLRSTARAPRMKAGSLIEGDTGFTGRLIDADGRPVPGAFALAYGDRDFHRMPEFTSLPANEYGRFTLYVPEAGTFCLAARSRTRGQPRAGEPYGLLNSDRGPCRSVAEGEVLDVGTVTLLPYKR